jgi:catechol 2,3-dioxygenase-like lactoylglutathione lyase family enzyme
MPVNCLHHITVKTDNLEATRDFYRDILGLEVGFRPDLNFPGYWLYCGDVPVVHLVPRQNCDRRRGHPTTPAPSTISPSSPATFRQSGKAGAEGD